MDNSETKKPDRWHNVNMPLSDIYAYWQYDNYMDGVNKFEEVEQDKISERLDDFSDLTWIMHCPSEYEVKIVDTYDFEIFDFKEELYKASLRYRSLKLAFEQSPPVKDYIKLIGRISKVLDKKLPELDKLRQESWPEGSYEFCEPMIEMANQEGDRSITHALQQTHLELTKQKHKMSDMLDTLSSIEISSQPGAKKKFTERIVIIQLANIFEKYNRTEYVVGIISEQGANPKTGEGVTYKSAFFDFVWDFLKITLANYRWPYSNNGLGQITQDTISLAKKFPELRLQVSDMKTVDDLLKIRALIASK